MRWLAVFALGVLSACAATPPQQMTPAVAPVVLTFPGVQTFNGRSPGPPTRANADMVRDFLDLSFRLESGRSLPVLTRFKGPITVRISGPVNQLTRDDLARLLARMRNEAGIDIRLTTAREASIVVQSVPNRALRRIVPNAACFVVPRVQTWAELQAARGTGALDWATLERRDKAAMFIPSDVTPQEIRDCLHEELAQALGPLNDLYALPDSVFNDDNIHAVLTGFDMLMLRAYYAPELQNGMTRDQVAARLPAILARLNPQGEARPPRPHAPTPSAWSVAIERALTDSRPERLRRAAAQEAIAIAERQGWNDTRAGFAHYVYGRLQVRNNPTAAMAAFATADRIYASTGQTDIHRAFVAVQLAAFALMDGDADRVLAITRASLPVARRHENAALTALLMMFEAEALDFKGDRSAGTAVRLDSLGLGLYGFGNREETVDRLNDIASLPPRDPQS